MAITSLVGVVLGAFSGILISIQSKLLGEIGFVILVLAILTIVVGRFVSTKQKRIVADASRLRDASKLLGRCFVGAFFLSVLALGFYLPYAWDRGSIVAAFCGLAVAGAVGLGIGRQFDLSVIVSYCAGGYAFALLVSAGITLYLAGPIAGVCGMFVGAFVAPIISMLNSEHQAALTMAYVLAWREVVSEWRLFGGATGIGIQVGGGFYLLVLAVGYLVSSLLGFFYLQRSSLGRAAVTERENPRALQVLGGSPGGVRIRLLGIQGLIASFGGVVYFAAVGYISPRELDVGSAMLVFMVVMMGGMEEIWGVVMGGVLVSECSESLLRYGSLNRLFLGFGFLVFTLIGAVRYRGKVPYEFWRPFLRS